MSWIPSSSAGWAAFISTMIWSARRQIVGRIPTPDVGTSFPSSVSEQASTIANFGFGMKP